MNFIKISLWFWLAKRKTQIDASAFRLVMYASIILCDPSELQPGNGGLIDSIVTNIYGV